MADAKRAAGGLDLRGAYARGGRHDVGVAAPFHRAGRAGMGRGTGRDRTAPAGNGRRRKRNARGNARPSYCGSDVMTELIIERSAAALEPVGDGWTVYGRAVPYGLESRVSDDGRKFYFEEFQPGAF